MKIQVQIKNVYGNETIYPLCETAQLLCKLAGTKSFTAQAVKLCKQLGYEFVVISQGVL